MAQSINQLVSDMQALRDRLSDGSARNAAGEPARGDVDAAIEALGGAIAALTGEDAVKDTPAVADTVSEAPLAAPGMTEVTDAPPPYAVVAAEPGTPDNLTLIRGISSATAYALTAVGITRFAHIAGLTASDVTHLRSDLGYRCTIHRNNWIEQAAILARGDSTSFSRRGGPIGIVRNDAVDMPAASAGSTAASEAEEKPQDEVTKDVGGAAGAVAALAVGVAAASAARDGSVGSAADMDGNADLSISVVFEELMPAPEPSACEFNGTLDPALAGDVLPIDMPDVSPPMSDDSEAAASSVVETDATIPGITAGGVLAGVAAAHAMASKPSEADGNGPLDDSLRTEGEGAYSVLADPPSQTERADSVFAALPEPVAVLPPLPGAGELVARVASDASASPDEPDETNDAQPSTHEEMTPEPAAMSERASPPTPNEDVAPPPTGAPQRANGLADMLASTAATQAVPSEPAASAARTGLGAMLASNADPQEDALDVGANEVSEDTSEAPPDPSTHAATPSESAHEAPFAPIIRTDRSSLDDTSGDASDVKIHVSEDEAGAPDRLRADLEAQFAPAMASEPSPPLPIADRLSGRHATIDPLPEPFSPHKTAVDEAEIVIVRDGEAEAPPLSVPQVDERGTETGLVGRLSRMFGRKS